jgi:peptidoglycan hydrolase-like protein with peptidoglycan-binding domain
MPWGRSAAIAIIAAACLFGGTSPAAIATPGGTGYVDGNGGSNPRDDWAGEGLLGQAYHRDSGATGLWQAFLVGRGLLGAGEIDCHFGDNTAEATRDFQASNGLVQDGVVGAATFGAADDKLTDLGAYAGGRRVQTQNGSAKRVFWFNSSGRYHFFEGEATLAANYHSYDSYCD